MLRDWFIIYKQYMYRYLKYLLVILIVFVWFFSKSFSAFEDKMYCEIGKDKIVISLDSRKNHTCNVYIRYIESKMKNIYKDTLVIQKYIDQKSDLGYWKPLKDDKVQLLNQLQNMRLNILAHMKSFEDNLIETSKKFFLDSIYDYRKRLSLSLDTIVALQDPSAARYVSLLEQQLGILERISQAKTFDQLDAYIKRYVYLKQQLEWK